MNSPTVKAVSAYWVRAPLNRPYGLSFGTLDAFDLILVRLEDSFGRVAYGESCPVPPYSKESADEVWASVCKSLPELCGQDVGTAARAQAVRADTETAFSHVAIATACESLSDPPPEVKELRVPIVGAVQTHEVRKLPTEVSKLQELGYRTLKVKVGFDPLEDVQAVGVIQDCVDEGVHLRLDANEAWDYSQADRFLSDLNPEGIELLEQPFPRDRWDWVTALKEAHPGVPLMLDESIHDEHSIRQAAEAGADIVKLKLMKVGSRGALQERTTLAQELGMSVVIGNGVAGVVDNWHEALCASLTERAGEMNGNLKLKDPVVDQRPILDSGDLRFPAGFRVTADEDALARQSQQTLRLG